MSGARQENYESEEDTSELGSMYVCSDKQIEHPKDLPPSSRPLWMYKIPDKQEEVNKSGHQVFLAEKKSNASVNNTENSHTSHSLHYIKFFLNSAIEKPTKESKKNAALLAQTEAFMAAINKLIAGDLIPSVHSLYDDKLELVACSSKNLDDFIPNRKDPLKHEDLIVEPLEKETEKNAQQYRDELQNILAQLIQDYNRDAPADSSYFTKACQFFKNAGNSLIPSTAIALKYVLESWQNNSESAKYDPTMLKNILKSLEERRVKSDGLLKTAESDSDETKINNYKKENTNLDSAIHYVNLLFIYKQVSYSNKTLQMLALLAKRRQDALNEFFSSNNIPRASLKDFMRIDKLYRKREIDIDQIKVKEIEEAIDDPSNPIKIQIKHLKRYRELNDIKNYQYPAELVDFENIDKPIQVNSHDFQCISQNDLDNYITLRNLGITMLSRNATMEGDLHNNNIGKNGSVDFDYSDAPRVAPFRKQHPMVILLQSLGFTYEYLTKDDFNIPDGYYENFPDNKVKYYWATILTPFREALINAANGVSGHYEIAKNCFTQPDVDVFKKLAYNPTYKFFVYTKVLEIILIGSNVIRGLAKSHMNEHEDYVDDKTKQTKFLFSAMERDLSDHFKLISKQILKSAAFKNFLALHGDYAMSIILQEFKDYKTKLQDKLEVPPETAFDAKSVHRREKQANNKQLYECYRELESAIDLEKIKNYYKNNILKDTDLTAYRRYVR